MSNFIEKNRKTIFYIILGCTFICIFAYNYLTPYLSDDYAYLSELRENAAGFGDVIRLAYAELFEHGGRFLHYVTFRTFFYLYNKQIFNFCASVMFVMLGLAVYANIEKKKKYDITVLMLSYLLIWLYAISFGETVLWVTGAVVYLFATTYILLSLALYKHLLNTPHIKKPVLMCVLMFVLALFAGNSSENNSGAAIMLLIIYTINKFISEKKSAKGKFGLREFIRPYMIVAFVGYILGYGLLVLAPGAHNRATAKAEGEYTGIVGILSNVYKLTLSLRDYLMPFMIAMVILIVILAVKGHFRSFKDIRENNALLFILAAIASTYVLMFIPLPVKRVFFGASIFFIIAVIQLFMELRQNEEWVKIAKYSIVGILCLTFVFTYLDNLVNLARTYRDENERINIIEDAVSRGKGYVEVPMYHEEFRTEYSAAYESDIGEDTGYWINTFYENWYGIDRIAGIPRDIWDVMQGWHE